MAVRKYLPKVEDKDMHSLLISATCFGVGSESQVAKDLKNLADNTDGTYEACMKYAAKKFDEDCKKFGC